MTFVPVIVTPPPVSANARELASRIRQVIQEFEQSHPGTNPLEIAQALQLAAPATGNAGKAVVAVAVALVLMLALGVFAFARAGGEIPQQWLMIALVAAGVVALGLGFAFKR